MPDPAIQSINQHTQKTSLDWLYNILVQPSTGTGSGVAPAVHEQYGLSLDLLRQALVEVTNVVNVLTTTDPGKVLDARQGKALADQIAAEIAKYAQPNGIATLGSDGKIPASQIPSIALVDVFTVASQAEMLALDAEQGDMAIRSDTSQVFILSAAPATTIENWIELSALKALVDAAVAEVKGVGYTDGTLKTHEDRLDTLEGADTVVGSVAKTVKDAVNPIDTRLTGLDTITYEGITYRVSRKIENGHLVTVYTEVA